MQKQLHDHQNHLESNANLVFASNRMFERAINDFIITSNKKY